MTREIPYIATNPDLVCPTEYGSVPDCGSVCQMIFNATGKRPVVIGKPTPLMPQLAMERLGFSKEETCVIETSHDRTQIRILKSAISRVDVKAEDAD